MIVYRDIWEARTSGDKELLNEVSLGRVYQHVKKSGENGSLCLISAFRYSDENDVKISKKKNLEANKRLLNDIRSMGLGAFKVIGNWSECQDDTIDYADCPKDKLVPSKEMVFGVPSMTLAQAKKLTKKYNQDASVYLGKETNGKATLVWRNGKMDTLGSGAFSPQKVAQGWSKVKGGHWTFEGFDYPAQSWTEVLLEDGMRAIRGK